MRLCGVTQRGGESRLFLCPQKEFWGNPPGYPGWVTSLNFSSLAYFLYFIPGLPGIFCQEESWPVATNNRRHQAGDSSKELGSWSG